MTSADLLPDKVIWLIWAAIVIGVLCVGCRTKGVRCEPTWTNGARTKVEPVRWSDAKITNAPMCGKDK